MALQHVTAEQLLAWLDGEPGSEFIGWHIHNCTMCASYLADERLFRCLLKRKPGQVADTVHIGDETLAAYADERLQQDEMKSIFDHLTRCDRCLLELIDLRYLMHATDDDAAASESFPGLAGRLLDLGKHWLGQLRIQTGDGWAYTDWMPLITEPALTSDLSVEDGILASKSDYSVIEAGRYRLMVSATRGDDSLLRLNISVTLGISGEPVPALTLMLVPARDEVISSTTDEAGRVVFQLDQDEAEIHIGERPVWRIGITIDSIREKT
ncbi:hypothetical protein ACFL1S_09080 [Pseudomonadota bacterium]